MIGAYVPHQRRGEDKKYWVGLAYRFYNLYASCEDRNYIEDIMDEDNLQRYAEIIRDAGIKIPILYKMPHS